MYAAPDPEHIEILRSGPKVWNAWREQNPSIIPNLSGTALKSGDWQVGPLHGGPINLAWARLREAVLRFATLSGADLRAADMSDADLTYAQLDHANLTFANLSNAHLDYANFAGAVLAKINLSGANLQHARNLTQEQINDSVGNASTILPSHLRRPALWPEMPS